MAAMRRGRAGPGQLAMFMTPRQIVQHYQPLDGDREEADYDPEFDQPTAGVGRTWEFTQRPARTDGYQNLAMNREVTPGKVEQGYTRQPRMESDEQVWSRKLEESQYDPDWYDEHRGKKAASFDVEKVLDRGTAPQPPSTNAGTSRWDSYGERQDSYIDRKATEHAVAMEQRPSLYESVRDEGVQQPVHLGTQFGAMGKREIVGGHHRIAAALDAAPDRLIPVLHHTDVFAAQGRQVGGPMAKGSGWNGVEDTSKRPYKYT